MHSKSNLNVAAMQCLIYRHPAARSVSRPIFRVFRLSSPRYLHLLLDGPRHLHSTCCSRPIPRMIQRCRHCAVRHFSLFCGQLSIFGSDLGFKWKAFPNLERKSRNCGQNMSVAVVACSSRLESVKWHDNALFCLSHRFSNRGLDLGNGTGTGKVAHDWLRGESGGDDIRLLGCYAQGSIWYSLRYNMSCLYTSVAVEYSGVADVVYTGTSAFYYIIGKAEENPPF